MIKVFDRDLGEKDEDDPDGDKNGEDESFQCSDL